MVKSFFWNFQPKCCPAIPVMVLSEPFEEYHFYVTILDQRVGGGESEVKPNFKVCMETKLIGNSRGWQDFFFKYSPW